MSEPAFKIERFMPLSISRADFEKLGDRERGFLAAICFAMNDISIFTKLLVMSFRDQPDDDVFKHYHVCQQNVLLRSLTAKVFEYLKCLEGQFRQWERRPTPPEELERFTDIKAALEELSAAEYFEISREMRNKLTNHYSSSDFTRYSGHLADDAALKFIFHDQVGNTVYPIGEEVGFAGFLNQVAGENERGADFVHAWMDWILGASRWSAEATNEFLRYYLFDVIGIEPRGVRTIFCDPSFVQNICDIRLPMIVKSPD